MNRKQTPKYIAYQREYSKKYRIEKRAELKAKKAAKYAENKEAHRIKGLAYRAKNKEKLAAYDKERRARDPEKKRALDREYRLKNRDMLNEKRAPYFEARKSEKSAYDRNRRDTLKDELKAKQLIYYKNNKHIFNASVVRRNARELQAMPKWANEFFMQEAYELAARRTKLFGFKWHVDHVVPLQSKMVCGLHAHTNMAVIPASVNLTKGNRYWPDMP